MSGDFRCVMCGAELNSFHWFSVGCMFAENEASVVTMEHCISTPMENGSTQLEGIEVGIPTGEGNKDDSDKLRYDLIPPETLEALAWILTFGAKKYGDRNWEKGMKWGRPFAALMRHMWAWWGGYNLDPETGKSHLWHALACLAFLVTFEERGIGTDDRFDGKS